MPVESLTWSTLTCSLQISNSKSQTLRRHFSKDKAEVSVKTLRVLSRLPLLDRMITSEEAVYYSLVRFHTVSFSLCVWRGFKVPESLCTLFLSDASRGMRDTCNEKKTLNFAILSPKCASHFICLNVAHMFYAHCQISYAACWVSEVNYGTNGIFAMLFECL